MKIRESKKQNSFFRYLFSYFKEFIDPEKEELIIDDISTGLGNRVAYQKFPGFVWPLWLSESSDFYSINYRSSPEPLLLNKNFREWQTLTNYLSNDEISVDRCGMVTGPGNSPWSVEFWYLSGDKTYYPQKNLKHIQPVRNHNTGEIIITGNYGNFRFCQRIAGGRSNVDEALISYETEAAGGDDVIFVVIRPYNCLTLGGLKELGFDNTSFLVKINGVQSIALEKKPDFIKTGSGSIGDVDCLLSEDSGSVECGFGMASMAIGYKIRKGISAVNLRISLDKKKAISVQKFDTAKAFKEFGTFSEMRLNEGLKIELSDENMMKYFKQSKISLFNNNAGDFNPEKISGFKNLYFFSYAMNRAGLEMEAEKLVNRMIEKLKYNNKAPDYITAIKASYLLNAFYECYIHKRETEFLQSYFPVIRNMGDYIYRFSTDIHSVSQLPGSSNENIFLKEASDSDFIILLSAMINISYLSRCMGIFGDEVKYKNEADRIQSIVKNNLEKKRDTASESFYYFYSLIAFPDAILTVYKEDEVARLFSSISGDKNYPLFDSLCGIDMFSSAMVLIHLINMKDPGFNMLYSRYFSFIDDFFTLPEFIDPVLKRGVWGNGNSKITAALVFIIMRNRLFLDRPERLEIFPAPDNEWFKTGSKIKVENASTRYGRISFISETFEDEIKLTFTGLPKFIPSDIMINIPGETVIMESDDFIVKRKTGSSYIINGWPSIIRFTIVKGAGSRDEIADMPLNLIDES